MPPCYSLESAISRPKRVIRLDLDVAEIESWGSGLISRFANLQELIVMDLCLSDMPVRHNLAVGWQAGNGRYPALSNRRIVLPGVLASLPRLSQVRLFGHDNFDFDKIFQLLVVLPSLTSLELLKSAFRYLPEAICRLRKLESLTLAQNPDLDLQQAFLKLRCLSKLKYLGLGGNKYRLLPPEIAGLANLEGLWLAGNLLAVRNCQLTEVPDNLSQLSGLKELNLSKSCFSRSERMHIRQTLGQTTVVF